MNVKTRSGALGASLALAVGLASILMASPTTVRAAAPSTAALASEHPAMRQMLSLGSSGHWVDTLQADLALLGYPSVGPMTGIFGPRTQTAVEAFQQENGLPVTGQTNEQTWQDILAGFHLTPYLPHTGDADDANSTGASATTATTSSAGTPTTIDGYPVIAVYHMTATAYGPSLKDNYPYGPVDAFGQPLQPGMIAVDPSIIPLTSRVYVQGYTDSVLPTGGFLGRAMDTGGAIKGHRIDIFLNQNPQIVSNFGIEPVTVYVLG